jgi:signal transduction histidine kinase
MTSSGSVWRRAWYRLTAPVRFFRQRTIAQLMVSHVAVVLITFLLLNLLVLAVMLGWLPGRQLFGLQEASQDMFLGERTRAMALWLDVDDLIAEHGSLDAPEARQALNDQLEAIVNNQVPGYEIAPAEAGSVDAYWGMPRTALVTDAAGVVVASSDPAIAEPGAPANEIARAGVRRALQHSIDLEGDPDPWSGIAYSVTIDNDVTSAATPLFTSDGRIVGYLAMQGYPLPEILSDARAEVLRDIASSLVTTSWIYLIPAILVAIPFAYLQARSTSRRLERLAHLADAFADGDMHTRLRVTRRDEIGRLAERFNEMGTRIDEDSRSRRTFLSNIAHELRTPVAIIQGTAEQLEAGSLRTPEEKDRAIGLVHLEIQNLTRLIDDLSTLGRLEEAKLRLDLQPVDTHDIASEAVRGLKQAAWRQRKVSIENLVPPDLPLAFADPGRVRQVIHNLLFNALRHTPEGGLVVVQGAVAGGTVELSVSDTGIGIPPEKLEQVFTRYYQAELSERSREGSGLGLHIVQQLVEAQGGTITIQSDVGKGTTFRFTLPLSARQPAARGSRRSRLDVGGRD